MSKTIKMTLVTREGCIHCAQTKELLKKIGSEYPELDVREVDMTTPEGQELIGKYGIMSSPGIIINDELFAMGGTTEKELREKFSELK
ncbi:MAG: thioredoxin family protein [Parcubacteria group bacterium]|nr:thioredoxin family protein [Parcubacteria group bacterium]